MTTPIRLAALFLWTAAAAFPLSASADYEGASGYGSSGATYEGDASHDGYPPSDFQSSGDAASASETPSYVVIEVEDGVSEEVDGETVIVVQEPEPLAATASPPPPPRVVAVEQPIDRCPGGIWVDGYWTYADGQYVWVDGHCVVERVNYVFVHPRWDFYSNVWWFVPGYYRPCSVWVGFGYYRPWFWFPPYHRAYYRGYRGVPVHRRAPIRPTVARPASRSPARGVLPARRLPTRAPTVSRLPTRSPTVVRRPQVRGPVVNRPSTTVDRAPTVARAPTRAPTASRLPTRSPTVARPASRSPVVSRPSASVPRTPTVGRGVSRPSPTSAVTRTRVPASSGAARTGSVTRSPVVSTVPSRPSTAARPTVGKPSRIGMLGGSSVSPSRAGGARPSFSKPGMKGPSMSRPSTSRPSMGARPSFGGRGGSFSKSSFGGFGGGRSVPTARGR